MNSEEKLIFQEFKVSLESMGFQLQELKKITETERVKDDLPEWITLEKAAALKGGPALSTYKTKQFLQPCCGHNSKLVGGRKCWHREQILIWLAIDDSSLKTYAQQWNAKLPEIYKQRSA